MSTSMTKLLISCLMSGIFLGAFLIYETDEKREFLPDDVMHFRYGLGAFLALNPFLYMLCAKLNQTLGEIVISLTSIIVLISWIVQIKRWNKEYRRKIEIEKEQQLWTKFSSIERDYKDKIRQLEHKVRKLEKKDDKMV